MKILLVAATAQEVQLMGEHKVLITGIGMVATAIEVARELATHNYDHVYNVGIAGAFDRALQLGEVVEVTEDLLAELGVEDGPTFKTFDAIGLKVTQKVLSPAVTKLKSVRGITVNTVHGDEASIKKVMKQWNPQVESMEGAACMLACARFGVPCTQIRAISNYVERRNREAWKIPLAIENLNTWTHTHL